MYALFALLAAPASGTPGAGLVAMTRSTRNSSSLPRGQATMQLELSSIASTHPPSTAFSGVSRSPRRMRRSSCTKSSSEPFEVSTATRLGTTCVSCRG